MLTSAVCGALVAAGCENGESTNPTPTGPKITCPASQVAQSSDGSPVVVSYPAPTSTGGAPPVVTTCTPLSGSTFRAGTTTVTCVTADAQQHSDSCTFPVVVNAPPPPPALTVTRFLAFGDSETEGKVTAVGDPYGLGNTGPSWTYPSHLKARLQSRYTTQANTLVVTNGGCGGEGVIVVGGCTDTSGQARLRVRLDQYAPQVLLLMEGVNDLNAFGAGGINSVVSGLRAMVADAQSRGVTVFIATVPPQRPGSQRGTTPELVPPLNDGIRSIAASTGATLADVYQAFGGSPDPWIGPDGLHPTEQGYDKIAETFFLAIQRNLEMKPTSSAVAPAR